MVGLPYQFIILLLYSGNEGRVEVVDQTTLRLDGVRRRSTYKPLTPRCNPSSLPSKLKKTKIVYPNKFKYIIKKKY